jgi:hypothetical protein
MPRELLLPIPHHIADKVHHVLDSHWTNLASESLEATDASERGRLASEALQFRSLNDKLDTLAREAGVLGW